ncbi:MAG: hypothetical protein Fur0037_17020 [Planctomycetota bacterium]
MRLLFVIHQFFPFARSGTEQYCLAVAREGRRRGHHITILSYHDEWGPSEPPVEVSAVPYDGFEVLRLRHWIGLNPSEARRDYENPSIGEAFGRVLSDVRPDAVHFFHLRKLGANLIGIARKSGYRTVVSLTDFWFLCPRFTLRRGDGSLCQGPVDDPSICVACTGSDPEEAPDLIRRKDAVLAELASADRVIAPSRFLAERFADNGFPPERIDVLPYGLDRGRVRRIPVDRPRNPLRLAFAGVFSPWKGAAVAIEAVRMTNAPVELTLWGNDRETMFLDHIAELKRSAGDDPRIRFAGPYGEGEIDRVFAQTDVLIVPSLWYENTPFVILEAFEAGVPVVATDLGGMSEIVTNGVNGYTFPAGDAASLSRLIEGLVADPSKLRRLTPRPPTSIRNDWDRFAEHYAPSRAGEPGILASRGRAAAWAGAVPAAWLLWIGVGATTLLIDLLFLPIVSLARARRMAAIADEAPSSRNASILILNWNGRGFLADLLPTLRVAVERCPGDHEVIVVDNGSDDGSASFCREHHPWVKVVALPENLHFVRGYREGVKAATRDILVLLNNDMTVDPDFLVELLAPFGPPDIFAVTSAIEIEGRRDETGRTRIVAKKGALRFEQVSGPDCGEIPAAWAGGGSSAFDRRKFEELDGFETLYAPCYVEDVSLSWRAWKRGWRILFAGGSRVRHAFRGTSSRVFRRDALERLDRRNRELFFLRAVTDARLLLAHCLLLPWNLWKESRRTSLGVVVGALFAALPRVLRAIAARQRSRLSARRTDRAVLTVANDVREHRIARGALASNDVLVLRAAGETAPDLRGLRAMEVRLPEPRPCRRPSEDVWGLMPRRLWASAGDCGEAARNALRETDHEVVWCCGTDSLAAAAPFARAPVIWFLEDWVPSLFGLERARERRYLRRAAARAIPCCPDAETADRLLPWLGIRPRVLDTDRADAARSLVQEILSARREPVQRRPAASR